MNHWIIFPLLVPLVTGMLNLLLVRSGVGAQRVVSLLSTFAMLVFALLLLARAASGHIDVYELGNWPAPFGIVLVLDRLSALML
ncbi:MAG: monovalent cation/H+ antiporter subunit D, partial [Desulfomicrobium sp.]|nr:monovalent cation/H+ antiporter subunit D [Desulfomicrobium sp.]